MSVSHVLSTVSSINKLDSRRPQPRLPVTSLPSQLIMPTPQLVSRIPTNIHHPKLELQPQLQLIAPPCDLSPKLQLILQPPIMHRTGKGFGPTKNTT